MLGIIREREKKKIDVRERTQERKKEKKRNN